MPLSSPSHLHFDFDIDDYLNPFIAHPRLHLLPKPISRLLGYRSTPEKSIGSLLICIWAFVGAFAGISLVSLIYHVLPIRGLSNPPIIIASFGASAILEYNSISSQLAQPRNVILGQALSSIIGIAITKAFQLSDNFENLRWLAGALAVGTASSIMGLTKTIHPPAGATALLAATTPEITALGWFMIPLVLLGSVVMLVVACVVNNIQRQFPLYWWTEHDLSVVRPGSTDVDKRAGVLQSEDSERAIRVTEHEIIVPDSVTLTDYEKGILEALKARLRIMKGLG
jgi:CBS-domain-containing membrane protein